MNKYFEKLELQKILELLSNECSNETTKKMALEIEQCTDIDAVRSEISKTSCALELSIKFGIPAFYNFKNIVPSVRRAESGAALSLSELIEIKRMLQQIGMLSDWYRNVED